MSSPLDGLLQQRAQLTTSIRTTRLATRKAEATQTSGGGRTCDRSRIQKKARALMLLVNGNVEAVAAFLKHQSETGRDEQGLAVHWFVTTPMAQLLEMLATVDDKTDQDYRSVHQWLEEHALSEWITKLNTQEGVLPSTQTLRLQLLGSRGECVATPMPHNHHALRKWAQRFRMKHKLRIAKLDVHGGGRIEETRDKAPVMEPEKWFPRVEIVVQFCDPANSSPIWTSCSC